MIDFLLQECKYNSIPFRQFPVLHASSKCFQVWLPPSLQGYFSSRPWKRNSVWFPQGLFSKLWILSIMWFNRSHSGAYWLAMILMSLVYQLNHWSLDSSPSKRTIWSFSSLGCNRWGLSLWFPVLLALLKRCLVEQLVCLFHQGTILGKRGILSGQLWW